MINNPELLKKLLEKIENTPNEVIEEAIDSLAREMFLEEYSNNNNYYYLEDDIEGNFNIESENKEWKENLVLAA